MNLQSLYVAVTKQQVQARQKHKGSGEYPQSQLCLLGVLCVSD